MLLQTKLLGPRVDADFIERSSLHERLNRGLERNLILISGPAGYGKSTLAAAWLKESPLPVVWLSLDARDSELMRFLDYCLAAVKRVFPQGLETTASLLHGPTLPSNSVIATTLNNEISDLSDDFVLVLDDYHTI